MKKIAVIYWSQTGNTQLMAEAIAASAKEAGADAQLFDVSSITAQEALGYDALALGCPAMGSEVLEEDEFEPFFQSIESQLSGKKIALFGSYDWGDGEWMRDWVQRCNDAGALLVSDQGLMANNTPDAANLQECSQLGVTLTTF